MQLVGVEIFFIAPETVFRRAAVGADFPHIFGERLQAAYYAGRVSYDHFREHGVIHFAIRHRVGFRSLIVERLPREFG